jgi:ATP-binding cassette subfamily B protein
MKENRNSKHWINTLVCFVYDCKGKLFFSVLSAVISVFGGILPYYGLYKIVVMLIDKDRIISQYFLWIVFILIGFILQIIFHMLSTSLSHQVAYTILCNIRNELAKRLAKAPLGVVLNEKKGKMKNIIIDRVEGIEIPIAHMIPEGFSNLLLSISVFVLLIIIDYRFALAMSISIIIAFGIMSVTLKDYKIKYQKAMKTSDYVNSVIVEYSEGIEVIKMFNNSEESYEKYEKAVIGFRNHILEWYKSVETALNFSMALLPTTLLGVVPVGVLLYKNGIIAPAEFVLAITLSMGVVPALMNMMNFLNKSKEIEYALDSASELLNIEQLEESKKEVNISNYNIEIKNVCFGYQKEKMIIKGIDMFIKEGKFSALIGPSGSGKSTIAKLIARFWDVTSGEILIGGINIKKIPLKQLSKIISFVTQDNFLFDCSIMDNIRMGNINATNEDVIKVSKAARCHDFILALEKGYDTQAGEAGNKLSGGEKQRIAIARAMLKNAPIVILDEATTYTDVENEYEIQKSLAELTKGKTLIVIAHRLSTIKNADSILLMKNGLIKAEGNHNKLIKTCKMYKNMWESHKDTENIIGGRRKSIV